MIILSEVFKIALQSLLRNKLRSILTMLGIIIGVASVILLISIGSGIQGYITQQFESLGSNLIYVIPGNIKQGGGSAMVAQRFTQRDVTLLRRLKYPIKEVSGNISVYSGVKYRNKEEVVEVNGLEASALAAQNYEAEKGKLFTQSNNEKKDRVALIGPKIATKLFGNENPVGKSLLVQSTKYRVVGVFKSKGGSGGFGPSLDEQVLIPITTAQSQFNQDKYNALVVNITSKDEIPNATKKIENTLIKIYKKDEFSVVGKDELLKTINQILGVMTAGLGGIAAISLLVGGIGIMNIMFVTVTERTKEIGLRKALGARPRDILIQFLIEAVTVSLVGGGIGISLAIGASLLLSRFLSSQVTLGAILLAFGFSSLIGVIFGVVPAWKAAKLDPIKALRYE